MKYLCILFVILKTSAFASYQGCGEYVVNGRVELLEDNQIIVNVGKGTQSENHLTIKAKDKMEFVKYLNQSVKVQIELLGKYDGTIGEISKLKSIEFRISDPLHNQMDGALILTERKKCLR